MIASFKKIDRSEYFVGYFYKIIRGNFGICVKKYCEKVHTRAVTVSFRPYYILLLYIVEVTSF